MNKFISSLLAASSVALIYPMAFPHVVEGCKDPSYLFATRLDTPEQRAAAAEAKSGFCMTAGF